MLPVTKHLMRRYQFDANKRGYDFNLTCDEFQKLIDGACVYCGVTPEQKYTQKQYKIKTITYNGIDRVNNGNGYKIGNVVSCCGSCNKSKKDRETCNRRQTIRKVGK